MSNGWNFVQAPFGGIAYSVGSDGSVSARPAFSVSQEKYRGPIDRDADGNAAAWVFNNKAYTDGARIEISTRPFDLGQPSASPVMFSGYTDSARRQLEEWLESHYAELATPRRIAEARLRLAESTAGYADEDAAKANKAARLARDEVEAARANLAHFGE